MAKETECKKTLVAKLVEVMKEVERIPKTGYNQTQKYHYTEESEVVERVRAALAARNVFLKPHLKEHSFRTYTTQKGTEMTVATVVMEFTFIDADTGETMSFDVIGEGQDSGDKAVYKAMTGATKYALMKSFLIPTGDDPERDEDEPTQQKRQQRQQQKQTNAGKMNGQQAKRIVDLTTEIAGNDMKKKQQLEETVRKYIPGFKSLSDEMPAAMADRVIEILEQIKKKLENRENAPENQREKKVS